MRKLLSIVLALALLLSIGAVSAVAQQSPEMQVAVAEQYDLEIDRPEAPPSWWGWIRGLVITVVIAAVVALAGFGVWLIIDGMN